MNLLVRIGLYENLTDHQGCGEGRSNDRGGEQYLLQTSNTSFKVAGLGVRGYNCWCDHFDMQGSHYDRIGAGLGGSPHFLDASLERGLRQGLQLDRVGAGKA